MWHTHPRGPQRARLLSLRAHTLTHPRPQRTRHGFTLPELLIVLLIISLMIGLLLPALSSARAAARQIRCASSLRQLYLTTRMYADSYRTLPVSAAHQVLSGLDLPAAAYRCKEDKSLRSAFVDTKYSSYTYLAPVYMDPPPNGDLSKLKPLVGLRRYENNPLLPLFWDREANHSKDRNVVYWNGVSQKRNWE
jgi:prepilin-type N-terminal cleavage/methylation domain-containing protein